MTKNEILERYVDRDIANLHPIARDAFTELSVDLANQFKAGRTKTEFKLFEGYRSPQRQRYLFGSEPKVTNADAYQSAHNFGLACDFVAWEFRDRVWQWSWDDKHDWPFLRERAMIFGLSVPITWDRGHVEHPSWHEHRWLLRNL